MNQSLQLPLLEAQRHIWAAERLHAESPAHVVPIAVRFVGRLDPLRLQDAVSGLVQRHENLRARIAAGESDPCQTVEPSMPLALETIELTSETDLHGMLDALLSLPMDVERDRLIRVWLLRIREDVHVVFFAIHHIVFDGSSAEILVRDLSSLYAGHLLVPEIPPVTYSEFVRQTVENSPDSADLAWWKTTLEKLPPPSQLLQQLGATGSRRRVAQTLARKLDDDSKARLKALIASGGVTPFMFHVAVAALLFERHTGHADITFGVPMSTRRGSEDSKTTGLFVNMLPLRLDVQPKRTFREILKQVHSRLIRCMAHGNVSSTQLRSVMTPEGGALPEALFGICLNYAKTSRLPSRAGQCELMQIGVPNRVAPFELNLLMNEVDGEWEFLYEFDSAMFSLNFMQALVERHALLVASCLSAWDVPSRDLQLFTPRELELLLNNRRATDLSIGVGCCIHELFERQVRRNPASVAVVAETGSLSYAQLDARADLLASALRERGVESGAVVGVCLHRGLDLIVALLGTLKAGAAYLPIEPELPEERVAYMLADTGAKVVVSSEHLRQKFDGKGVDTLRVDAVPVGSPAGRVAISPDALAYCIYTSGSTGRPKGVLVTHRNVTRLIHSAEGLFDFSGDDVWTLFHSFAFDFSVWEIFGALATGGKLVVVPYLVSRSPDEFTLLLEAEGVTVLNQTPSAFRQLIATTGLAVRQHKLRYVIFGGEALEPQMLSPWIDKAGSGHTQLINMYGITETTVHVTFRRITREDLELGGSPIGIPLPDLSARILDPHLQLVPVGIVGELFVSGPGLARGYLNRPALTAERFLADPYGPPGTRMYRTGDLARRLASGELEYVGRIDHQVKIRGFRIELGEIEATLLAYPDVREAAVIAREDKVGDRRLVAYVAHARPEDPSVIALLRARLRDILPEHMIPSAWVLLQSLPLTVNGKLDKKALPPPQAASSLVRPVGSEEEVICAALADVLGLSAVGVDDDFFELGGDSLLAIKLIVRLRRALDNEVPVRLVFEQRTPRGIGRGMRRHAAMPAIRPALQSVNVPASAAQRRLWFLYQLDGPNPTYNIPIALRVHGDLSEPALRLALLDVVHRHESLRTVIAEIHGNIFQSVIGQERCGVRLSASDIAAPMLDEAVQAAASEPFRLEDELPIRGHLFRIAWRDHLLLIVIHHIAADGWSMDPLLRDLSTAYQARSLGKKPEWTPLPVQYRDYAAWQSGLLLGIDNPASPLGRQLAFWLRKLAGLPDELPLPCDRGRPASASLSGGGVSAEISPHVHQKLRSLAGKEGVTLFMALLSALTAMLTRLGAGNDIPIGTPIAGRNDEGLEDVVGLFVNTLVLRCETDGDPTFVELLSRGRATCLEAYANQDVPFEYLVQRLSPARSLARHPLFQTMLVVHRGGGGKFESTGLSCLEHQVSTRTAKFDLMFVATENEGGGLNLAVEFAADLFNQDSAETLVMRLARILEQVVDEPSVRVSLLDIGRADARVKTVPLKTAAAHPRIASAALVDRHWNPLQHEWATRTAVGAGTSEERAMCSLFEDVLDISHVGIDENFFDLGGHSLLAITLIGAVRERMDVELPVRAIFEAPTPRLLSRRAAIPSAQALSVLLPVGTCSAGSNVFCFHPASGLSWCYAPLARWLSPLRYSLYGLQACGLDGVTPLAESFDSLVRTYVGAIRSVQDEGPYHLLGWSLGGCIAQAVAVRLQDRNQEVASLVMLDSYPPSVLGSTDAQEAEKLIESDIASIQRSHAWQNATDPALLRDVLGRNYQFAREAKLQAFDGKVHLFHARAGAPCDPTEAWRGLVREIETVGFDLGHYEMGAPAGMDAIAPRLVNILQESTQRTVRIEG